MTRNLHRLALIAAAIAGATAAAQTEEAPPPPAASASAAPTRYAATDDAPVAPDLRTDVGWNRDWALLFSLNNPFDQNGFLENFQGTGAGMYFLSDTSAIRMGIGLERSHNPSQVIKTVITNGPDSVTTYNVTVPGTTESNAITARGEYLMRMGTGAIAPYLGGGAGVTYAMTRQSILDDISIVDRRQEWNDFGQFVDVTLRGVIGAEWRFHPQFAVFAEYGLAASVWRYSYNRTEDTVEVSAGGVPTTTRTVVETANHQFFNVDTALFQGASLGLIVLF